MLCGTWPTVLPLFLMATAYRSLEFLSYKPAVLQLPASSMHDNADRTVNFEFSCFFSHSAHVKRVPFCATP